MPSHPNPEDDEEQLRKNEEFETIHATDDDVTWDQDPESYLTIMPYPRKGKIMVRAYSPQHEQRYLIDGDHPRQIYYKIIKMGLITKLEHAAYLGKELQKAYVALKHGLHFNQDDELDFDKKVEP
ncbi:DUF4346 domain-containing protein [Candidatus Woesearchaeota archaeon]|nr:DUF4346 domain-containing protein [Candidatus Woesearchaeota archaeon]